MAATDGHAIVVEDHWDQGGLGDAVARCLGGEDPLTARVVHLAVREMPGSGALAELLQAAGIDATSIARAAERLLARARPARTKTTTAGSRTSLSITAA